MATRSWLVCGDGTGGGDHHDDDRGNDHVVVL